MIKDLTMYEKSVFYKYENNFHKIMFNNNHDKLLKKIDKIHFFNCLRGTKYFNKINWMDISKRKELPEDFIIAFKDVLNFNHVSKINNLSNNILIILHGYFNWWKISHYHLLTDEFLDKFAFYLNPLYISKNKNLNVKAIERFKNDMNWWDATYAISQIKSNEEKINLFRKYEDYININRAFLRIKLPEDIIRKYLKEQWTNILYHQDLTEDFITEIEGEFTDDDWRIISSHQKLSEDYIRNHADKLNWHQMAGNQKLSVDFIREFKDKFDESMILGDNADWREISFNQDLTEDFIIEFQDKLDWRCISHKQLLSEKFIEENINKIDLHELKNYNKRTLKNLSKKFKKKYNL